MHEHGLCVPLVEALVDRAAGRPVRHVHVRVGARHRVVAESFDEAFAHVAVGTVAAGASVALEIDDATATCLDCGHQFVSDDPLAACPACASDGVRVDGGDEIRILSATFGSPGS